MRRAADQIGARERGPAKSHQREGGNAHRHGEEEVGDEVVALGVLVGLLLDEGPDQDDGPNYYRYQDDEGDQGEGCHAQLQV